MEVSVTIIAGKTSKDVSVALPAVIGRSHEAGLKVANPMISRKHAELFENDGLLMVRDLGSLNGTRVNKQRIKEAPLPPESDFLVGPFTFRVHYEYAGDLNALPAAILDDRAAEAAAPAAVAAATAAATVPAAAESVAAEAVASESPVAAPEAPAAVEPTMPVPEVSGSDLDATDDVPFLEEPNANGENSFFDDLFEE